jgi:hypothetical protein
MCRIFQAFQAFFKDIQYSSARDGNSSDNFTPRGIEEWQFDIPRGSRKSKSTPRGPRGISRTLKVEMECYGTLFHSSNVNLII